MSPDPRHMAETATVWYREGDDPPAVTWFCRPSEADEFRELAPVGTRVVEYQLIPPGDCIVTHRLCELFADASQQEIGDWLVANGLFSRREPMPRPWSGAGWLAQHGPGILGSKHLVKGDAYRAEHLEDVLNNNWVKEAMGEGFASSPVLAREEVIAAYPPPVSQALKKRRKRKKRQ